MQMSREIGLNPSKVLGQSTFEMREKKVKKKYIGTLPKVMTSSTTPL